MKLTVPWEMKVLVPDQWRVPIGNLQSVQPAARLEAVAQRLRRHGVKIFLLGLDLTLNTLIDLADDERQVWVPHVNILTPRADGAAVTSAVRSLAPRTLEVLTPLLAVPSTDIWVATNYTAKCDLGGVRHRRQRQRIDGKFPFVAEPTGRLPKVAFREFLDWRSSFDATDLRKIGGLRWSYKMG
jgi:hypothetical protein